MSAGVKSTWIIVVAGRIPGAVLDARAGQLMRRTRPRQPSTFGRVEYSFSRMATSWGLAGSNTSVIGIGVSWIGYGYCLPPLCGSALPSSDYNTRGVASTDYQCGS